MRQKRSISVTFVIVVVVTALLILGLWLTAGSWYAPLMPAEQIQFLNEACVAYGTLALAIVTGASVWETQRVVASEDRRHQQSFAPLLLLTALFHDDNESCFSMTVHNSGGGLALKVLVLLEGECFADVPGSRLPPIPIPESSRTHHIGVVPVNSDAGLSFPEPMDFYGDVSLGSIRIEYSDMFGNEYITRYLSFSTNPNEFQWVRPKNLDFIPG